jgi:Tyrosine phosphatase family
MQPDWIDLDGTANTRDVGGLPTTDGRRTVSRRLLRSDNLQDLSAEDVRRLVDDYGVRTVADLRSDIEIRAGGPGPMTREPLVAVEQLSLFPERSRFLDALTQQAGGVERWLAAHGWTGADHAAMRRKLLADSTTPPSRAPSSPRTTAG